MSRKSFLLGLAVGVIAALALTVCIPSLAGVKVPSVDRKPIIVWVRSTHTPSPSPSPTPDPEPWPDDPEEAYYYGFDEGNLLGFESGYEEGYSEGYDEGYRDGYDSGYDDGHSNGYFEAEYDD